MAGPGRDPMDDFDDDDFLDDPDVDDLNNPDVQTLSEPPLLGVQPQSVEMFGEEAQPFGRATSPKLYSSAAHFPTAVQFRVWKWDNGVPVGLGTIDAEAAEDEFVRAFFNAMPRRGQGNYQFRLRPIDIRGKELGKEFTLNISEHHTQLQHLREQKKLEEEERRYGQGQGQWGRGGPMGGGGDIIVNPGGGFGGEGDRGHSYAEEMGRMFEQAVESAEDRTRVLQETLVDERERLRTEEGRRTEERVSMAERSALTTEKMMERLMVSDRSRSEEGQKAQKQHSEVLMNTLTTVFSQQQEAGRAQHDRQREADAARLQQDREFFDRQRQETETRLGRERDESDRRRVQERDEAERRRREDGQTWERKREEERQRIDAEQRRLEEHRKHELEQMRHESQRRENEMTQKTTSEKEDARLRLEREKMELESRREELRQERETVRQEAIDRRARELQEFERKMAAEREDRDRRERGEREERERRERADRDRWEKEKTATDNRREEERKEWARREELRREESTTEAERRREESTKDSERRREEMLLQVKQMDSNAQRDREHAERMVKMAQIERDAQREGQQAREKVDRDAREMSERERQRQYELQKFEMEQSRERDREHQERMMSLQKMEKGGGLTGITDMLDMSTPEVLQKIFSPAGEEEGGSWAEAIPKTLGALAEAWVKAQPPGGRSGGERPAAPRRRPAKAAPSVPPNMIPVQTKDGVRLIPADSLARFQAAQLAGEEADHLPVNPFIPEDGNMDDFEYVPAPPPTLENPFPEPGRRRVEPVEEGSLPAEEGDALPELVLAAQVDTIRRANDAGLKLSQQKKARRAIRELMPRLAQASADEWIGVVTESLVKQPAIYDYLKAVTVYAALAEANVEPDVAFRTVTEMRQSGLIPADVPYDEADYNLMAAAAAAAVLVDGDGEDDVAGGIEEDEAPVEEAPPSEPSQNVLTDPEHVAPEEEA